MNWLRGNFYLQFVQIAIGIVVAYWVWQNGRRQIDSLDKKLGKLIEWQMTNNLHDLDVVEDASRPDIYTEEDWT